MDILITIAFLALYYILGLGTVIALKTGLEEDVKLEGADYLMAAGFPILLFVVFILVYALTTRILESFEYESKMETLGKIAKAMIERGSNVNIENLMNELDREKNDKK